MRKIKKEQERHVSGYFKRVCFYMIVLVCGIGIGLLLLFGVFLLPPFRMQDNVRLSLPMLEREFEHSEIIMGYPASLVGSFTDCLMLEEAVSYDTQYSLPERVLLMLRGEYSDGSGWAPGYSLQSYLYGKEPVRMVTYARYWHGYLVVLKPLLLLWNVGTIRVMAALVQFLLGACFLYLCCKRGEGVVGMCWMVAQLFLYSFATYFSLSLSICYYLVMAAMLVQVKWHERLEENSGYETFFFVVGMSVAYFDFLTYPLVTLGIPLLLLLCLTDKSAWKALGNIVKYSLLWGVGYLGMWAGKWAVTDLWLGEGVIRDGISTLLVRTDTVESYTKWTGFLVTIQKNLEPFMNWSFALLLVGCCLILLVLLLRKKQHIYSKVFLIKRLPLLVVAVYPFLWFFITQNHGEQHYMFTCKTFAITAFALLLAIRPPKETGDTQVKSSVPLPGR